MAGLIARLFGGKASPADTPAAPLPGAGGYHLGPGPDNQNGFPGSTSQTRTFPGRNPINLAPRRGDWTTIKSETNYGFDQGIGTTPEIRQSSYRGDQQNPVEPTQSPRATPPVFLPQTRMRQVMQHNAGGQFYGGPMLQTGPGNNTAGGVPLSPAQAAGGHSQRDTTTPWIDAQPVINEGGAPGSENVRNTYAQRYKERPGQAHTYESAARPDTAPVNPGGQATDGNVHPERVRQDVTVPSRFVFDDGGNQSWSIEREMPYGGRGNGARGADLNGQRYYAAGQSDQFWNGGQGEYGIARQRGSQVKRPVSFTQPAPWTAQFYDTTDEVGTEDNPNPNPGQQPQAIYYSPGGQRASNSTGRMT